MGFLIAEMRLGKTWVVIRRLRNTERFKKILVLAPNSSLDNWKSELLLERESSMAMVTGVREDRLSVLGKYRWSLLNYEGLQSISKEVNQLQWDAIVLDESLAIANPKAKVTRACLSIPRENKVRIALSGLPNPEGPHQLCTQFIWVFGDFMSHNNFWSWRLRFFNQFGHDWAPRKGTREAIKYELKNRAFCMTRKQAGMKDEKIYQRRYVDMTDHQRAVYERLENDFVLQLKSQRIETKWITVQHQMLARVAGGYYEGETISGQKVREIQNLLNGELSGESVVIFFRFTEELKAVKKALCEKGIIARAIHGGTSPNKRRSYILSFSNGDVRVLCVQVKIGKYSWDLSRSSSVIYYSNPTSGNERQQSEDRIIHLTKKEPLLYIDLIAKGTVDEDRSLALREKKVDSKFYFNNLIELMEKRRRDKSFGIGG